MCAANRVRLQMESQAPNIENSHGENLYPSSLKANRNDRIFLSGSVRDFDEERDLLVRKVLLLLLDR